MMRKITLLAVIIGMNGYMHAQEKARITQIRNDSPFFVSVQNSDQTAKNIVNNKYTLDQDPFIVGPGQSISLADTFIPQYIRNSQMPYDMINISVNGVDTKGTAFTMTKVALQEQDGEILIDRAALNTVLPAFHKEKIGRAESYTVVIDKKGIISLKKN